MRTRCLGVRLNPRNQHAGVAPEHLATVDRSMEGKQSLWTGVGHETEPASLGRSIMAGHCVCSASCMGQMEPQNLKATRSTTIGKAVVKMLTVVVTAITRPWDAIPGRFADHGIRPLHRTRAVFQGINPLGVEILDS